MATRRSKKRTTKNMYSGSTSPKTAGIKATAKSGSRAKGAKTTSATMPVSASKTSGGKQAPVKKSATKTKANPFSNFLNQKQATPKGKKKTTKKKRSR